MPTYSGRVLKVVFSKEDDSFYILQFSLDEPQGAVVTAKGTIAGITVRVGTWIKFEGKFKEDPKWGPQISITRAPVLPEGDPSTWDAETVKKILSSSGLSGILVDSIHDRWGDRFVESLSNPAMLVEVPYMGGETSAAIVSEKWKSLLSSQATIGFMHEAGISSSRVRKIHAYFGEETKSILTTDPWKVMRIPGFTLKEADALASKVGLEAGNPLRAEGIADMVLRDGRGMGHVFSSTSAVISSMRSHDPCLSDQEISAALRSLKDGGRLMVDRFGSTLALYEPWFWQMETFCARSLASRLSVGVPASSFESWAKALSQGEEVPADLSPIDSFVLAVRGWIYRFEEATNTRLAGAQIGGIINALTLPVSVITGLPGTGKTTSLRVVLSVLSDLGIPFLVVAPTGIAAKRIQQVSGCPAMTVHRAFGARGGAEEGRDASYVGVRGSAQDVGMGDGSGEEWGFSPDNPHHAQVVVVDESSMVCQHILYRVLSCTRPDCRVVFVGDAAQLPSVAPGNVLHDIIATKAFPVVALSEVFRQKDASPIILASHAINAGQYPNMTPGFDLIQASSDEDALEAICKVVADLIQEKSSFQVLSPRHGGKIGVTNLNATLREMVNPKTEDSIEIQMGGETIRVGDRVMIVKNDYELGVFNGDTGKISSVKRGESVCVKVYGPIPAYVHIPYRKADQMLRLAYAVTVHKAQAQEWDTIVMPVTSSLGGQLQRTVFYTAVTRARSRVVLVGSYGAVKRAVDNDMQSGRNTLLTRRVAEALASPQATLGA